MAKEYTNGVTFSVKVADVYTQIAELKTATNVGVTIDYQDVTTQDSDGAKEIAPAMENGGEITCVLQVTDANRAAITALNPRQLEEFKIEWPGVRSVEVSAYPEVQMSVELNKYTEVTVKLNITGKRVWTDLT